MSSEPETVDLVVREIGGKSARATEPSGSVAHSAGELVASLAVHSLRTGFSIGRSVLRGAGRTRVGQAVSEIAQGIVDGVVTEPGIEWQQASRMAEVQLERVISVVVPVVVQSMDPMEVMQSVDVNTLVSEVDVDAVVERLDLNQILARLDLTAVLSSIDLNDLLSRIDLDAMLRRVDLDALVARLDTDAILSALDVTAFLERVDVDALMRRIDLDAVVDRIDLDSVFEGIDLDALLSRLDLAALAKQARVGELVVESTQEVTVTALDLGRRQAAAVDTLLARVIDRALGRARSASDAGPAELMEPEEDSSDDG